MKYKDPLHIPSSELVVWHNDKEHLLLNKRLLDKQNCWQNLELIKSLHKVRLNLEDQMADPNGLYDMKELNTAWTDIQFSLQKAWGFEENSNYHKFWDIPACECPKMDNNDNWPIGYYTISSNCPIHGSIK